jgi:hypothetical protein
MRVPFGLMDDAHAQVQPAAWITSGALAHAGRVAHPNEADKIDAALITRYQKARDIRESTDLLAAMGNSVGHSVLPVIESALRDNREVVRAAAARALRLAGGSKIDALLSGAITDDRDAPVRSAAIFAASFRRPIGPQIADALLRAAKTDPADYVRSNAIRLLRQNPDASPKVVETLSWIAEHDTNPSIRKLAREALSPESK